MPPDRPARRPACRRDRPGPGRVAPRDPIGGVLRGARRGDRGPFFLTTGPRVSPPGQSPHLSRSRRDSQLQPFSSEMATS